jgi:hypothetical protein
MSGYELQISRIINGKILINSAVPVILGDQGGFGAFGGSGSRVEMH